MSANATQHIRHLLLIADDSQANQALADALHEQGIGCVLAGNTGEVLEVAQRLQPDLILLEASAPGFSAREVALQLRQQRRSRDIPVIFLCAESSPENPQEAFAGTDYFKRPYELTQLLPRLNAYLALRNAQKQLQAQNDALQVEAGFLLRQTRLLEMIATNQPLDEVLTTLIHLIESQSPQMVATVSLLDETGEHIERGLAPSLDQEYLELLCHVPIGPHAGSCGTAMYRRRPVVVTDIASDPLWRDYRYLADPYGLRACWSTPIFASSGKVVGSFAMYYREVRSPSLAETRLLELATHIAGIAVERHETELRISHMASHDALTDLPNRALLEDRVGQALARARRNQHSLAILFIDLDHFKHVNDSLGHHAGDRLLLAAANRLRSCLRAADTIARLGGDEFVICLPDLAISADAATVAEKILLALSRPVDLAGHSLELGGSIGISLYPEDGGDPEALLRAADTAMYHAKARGRNQYQFFTPALNTAAQQRLGMLGELRQALAREEFELHYQPQLSLRSGAVVGAEALLRWRHPERGLISPAEFIPALEESGLIVQVGGWVIRTACRQALEWQRAGLAPVQVAANLSARQLQHHDIVALVRGILKDTGIDPRWLELEFTESVIFDYSEPAIEVMHELKKLGISLTLDDFGTGYSSLAYLHRFPVDRIKIDQSFIGNLLTPKGSAAIVRSILDMARHVGMSCVAEGVETSAQLAYLHQLGCAEMQGFLFSPALPAAEFAELLRSERRLELPPAPHPSSTVLIVDSDRNTANALTQLLRREGLDVLETPNADTAFTLLASHSIGVLVAGMRSGELEGPQFLQKAHSLYPELVSVLLAEAGEHAAVFTALNHGPLFTVIGKPWDNRLMVEHLRTALRWHEAQGSSQ